MAKLTQQFLLCMILSLSLPALADKAPNPQPQKPVTQPQPAAQQPNAVCFCADDETDLQGCAVGAVRLTADEHGAPNPVCLDPQVSVRPADKIPALEAPEACALQDIHTGEVRSGHVQCLVTGKLLCK